MIFAAISITEGIWIGIITYNLFDQPLGRKKIVFVILRVFAS